MNSLSEIQNKPNTAPSSVGFGVLADEIVANTPAGTTIAKLNSTDIETTNASITNASIQSVEINTGKGYFSKMKIPEWEPNTQYEIGEVFRRGSSIYFVDVNHTSQSVFTDFYIDWLVNKYVRPMGRHPGTVVNLINAGTEPGSNALLADGSEYDIVGKEDLYQYLNYGYTPVTFTFNQADVVNGGGYVQINKTNHGFYQGQVVEIIKGIGGGDFTNVLQTLFVRVINPNSFYLSLINHTQVTIAIAPIVYSGTPFIGNNHTIISKLWGVSSSPNKFRIPDFRGLLLANSGTNGFLRKYGNGNYTKEFGQYMYDKGLYHVHSIPDNAGASSPSNITQSWGAGQAITLYSNSILEPRANEDENSPAHAVVNCYILY